MQKALRFNENKVPMEMIPLHLLEGTAKVFGEQIKYPKWNWLQGMEWSIPYACILRHLSKWYQGEDVDAESGLNHLHHVMCNLLMLIHYTDHHKNYDNRPKEFFNES